MERNTPSIISLKVSPKVMAQLSKLQDKTGLNRSGVVKLAIAEMAEKRGV